MARSALRLAAVAAVASVASAAPYDVVVYGSTPGGIAAAIAASDGGRLRVALVEPLTALGGMGAAGGIALNDQQLSNLTMITG